MFSGVMFAVTDATLQMRNGCPTLLVMAAAALAYYNCELVLPPQYTHVHGRGGGGGPAAAYA